jgi:hypothetical protein
MGKVGLVLVIMAVVLFAVIALISVEPNVGGPAP